MTAHHLPEQLTVSHMRQLARFNAALRNRRAIGYGVQTLEDAIAVSLRLSACSQIG